MEERMSISLLQEMEDSQRAFFRAMEGREESFPGLWAEES